MTSGAIAIQVGNGTPLVFVIISVDAVCSKMQWLFLKKLHFIVLYLYCSCMYGMYQSVRERVVGCAKC